MALSMTPSMTLKRKRAKPDGAEQDHVVTRAMALKRKRDVCTRMFMLLLELVSIKANLHLFDALMEYYPLYQLKGCATAFRMFAQFVSALVTPRRELCDGIIANLWSSHAELMCYARPRIPKDLRAYYWVKHAVYNASGERTGFLPTQFDMMVRVTLVRGYTTVKVLVNEHPQTFHALHLMPGETIYMTPRYDAEGRLRYELRNNHLGYRRFDTWEALFEALMTRAFERMPAFLTPQAMQAQGLGVVFA